jgi:hypothetical protein
MLVRKECYKNQADNEENKLYFCVEREEHGNFT